MTLIFQTDIQSHTKYCSVESIQIYTFNLELTSENKSDEQIVNYKFNNFENAIYPYKAKIKNKHHQYTS